MFQSSRMASGMAFLQTTNASTPSSASMTSKPSVSTMRRAIFRTMLESSTTKQVFMSFSKRWLGQFLGGQFFRHHFEHAVDIEHDHEVAIETVNAACKACHARIEVDGVFLAAVFGQPQHLADLVDQQAI